jgi:transposase
MPVMDFSTFEHLVRSESSARKYVSKICLKNGHRICPFCGSRNFWKLGDGRRRCKRCRQVYTDFTRRWIGRGHLSCGQWLRLIKLFELEISTRRIANQLGLAYNTVYQAVTTIRLAIVAHALDSEGKRFAGEVELDESYFGGHRKGNRGRGAAGKVPVFGILERGGHVWVNAVPNVTAQTLLSLAVRKVRRGSIVYTDRYRSYDALMFCGYRHLKVDHQTKFAQGRVYINGLEGFWSFAKERLMKHHGISPQRFPLYLKELEFRYNHREQDIFTILVNFLCDFGPKLE